eukprot:m.66153 g.66153  ORF g.66153 m.66153 type:complete len:99 (+) comp12104_c0_seq1:156-452(+)
MSQAQVALSPQHTMHSESPQRKDGQIAKQQKAESDQDSEGDEDFGFEEATCPPAPGLATSSTSPYALVQVCFSTHLGNVSTVLIPVGHALLLLTVQTL